MARIGLGDIYSFNKTHTQTGFDNEMCEGICCGCTACQSICPKGAINIVEDQKGFLQPIINEDLCVDCNLCKKTCNEYIKKNEITDVFLIKLKDNIQHTISQSGGAFTAISDVIMDRNGTVFGVVMDDNLEAKYSKARSSHERDLMRGSKYMQARVENAYKEVQESLKEGLVLFTGTPCQVGGLLKYLSTKHIDTTNLYCICGDGGFQMNIQELETVKRENLPIKIFILNNRVLGKISETQHFNHGDRFANTAASGGYTVPDFTKIAEAYGIKAVKLNSYEDLENYKEWFYDKEPCLFDISLPEETFLTPKIKFETGMMSPKIDDEVFQRVKETLKK